MGIHSHHDNVYPARFRIPPDTVLRLGEEEKNKRSVMFALGSLLYEINSGNKPFEGLSDDEVQLRFSNGDFPDNIKSLFLRPSHGHSKPTRKPIPDARSSLLCTNNELRSSSLRGRQLSRPGHLAI
jgi:hypothetical protein